MRTLLFIFLFSAWGISHAQDRLEPFKQYNEDTALCLRLFRQELWSLLNPNDAQWGVIKSPSLMTESSLTYDAENNKLIYTEIDGILWGNVRNATTKRVDNGISISIINLKEVNNYTAPKTKTTSMPVSKSMIKKLNKLWLAAISKTAEFDLNVFDGTSYYLFADGKKAYTNGVKDDWVRVPRLQDLVDNLIKAVKEQDKKMLNSQKKEIDELYKLFVK